LATIDVNPPSGTRDFLPAEAARRARAFTTVREVLHAHGFAPLETPAFERLEVLTGRYGEEGDKLVFKILRRGEHEASGEADLALRYDLTVPLARVVARHGTALPMPFKRQQIASVWRADRPGKGRYREFTQCDLDTVGSSSPLADAETVLAVDAALAALGLTGHRVLVNARDVLRGLVEAFGIPLALEEPTLVAVDKLAKIGPDGVARELAERGVAREALESLTAVLADAESASALRERIATTERGRSGLAEVDRLLALVDGQTTGALEFTPVLARGLSYYTGPVFEVVHPQADGSIAAGGRYDGLVGSLGGQDVPATGGSLGTERVLSLLGEADAGAAGPDALLTVVDPEGAADVLALAQRLRRAGLAIDVYVDEARLGRQLRHAERIGARVALVRGEREREAGSVTIKHLASGEQISVPEDEVVANVRRLTGDASPDRGGPS
jgi:histidyl-tRNA synthetase